MIKTSKQLREELDEALGSIEDAYQEGKLTDQLHYTLYMQVIEASNAIIASEIH